MSEKSGGRISRFTKEVKVEMQKVSWPTKSELVQSTVLVIVVTILVTAFVGGVDYVSRLLVQLLVNFGAGSA